MKRYLKGWVCRRACMILLAFLFIIPLHADVIGILYETRPYAGGALADAAAYAANWNVLAPTPPPAGYGAGYVPEFTNLSNHGTFGGSTNGIAFHTLIALSLAQLEDWTMQFGIDYGFGGALFVDSIAVDFRNTDMWWSGSYGNPSQLLSGTVSLTAGSHTVELFGLEGCCDGATEGRYRIGTQEFQTFEAAVPEPSSAVLLFSAVGLAGLGLIRRKVAKKRRQTIG